MLDRFDISKSARVFKSSRKMSDSKKATKFTKLIAKQLKDVYSDGYDKEELKSSLEEAVKNLTKKEIIIKTEIQKNLGRYVRKLEKFLKAQIQDVQEKEKKTFFPYNLFKDDGSEIEKTENLTKDEKEVLVNNLIAERVIKKPEVMSMVDDLPSELDTFHQLSGCHRLLKLTSGYKHAESLRQIMLKYFRNIQPVAEDILKNTDEKRSEELAKEIKNFVTTCHMRNEYCSMTGEKKTPSYEDILSSLLSLYVDLKILSSRSVNSTKKKGKQFCGFIVYLLPCQHHQLDLLLNLTVLTQRDADLVLPLSRIILKWNKDNNDYKYYLKYVLAVRSIHDKLAECVSDIFESTKAIPAPKKFMSWLKEQDDELANTFPSDKRFKKIVVTRYLLEDVTEEQIDELLEIFVCKGTDDEEEMEIGVVCSATGQQSEDKLGPQSFCIDTVGDKSHPEESDELFFIDKLGGSSKEKIIDLEVEGQFENEDDAFDTMETDDKENSEKESGQMETEVFVIDSSNFIGKNYDKNLRNIEENEGKRTFGNNTKTEEVMFGRKSERNKSVQNDEITNTLQNKKNSNSREYISEEDRSGKTDDNRLKLDEEESETSMNKAKIHKTTSCTSEKPKAEELKLKEHDMQINVNVISQAEKQNSASKTHNLYSVEGSPKKRESPVMSERKREKKDLNSFQEESMEESDDENLFDGYLPALNCSEKSNVGNPGKMNVFSPGKSKIGSPQKCNVGTPQKRDVGSYRKGPRKHSIEEEGVNSEDSVGIRKKSVEDSENKVSTRKRTRKTSLRSNQNELAKAIIMDSNNSIGKTSLKTNKDSSEIGSIDVNVVGHDVLKDSETDTDFVLNLSVDDSDSDPEVVFNLSNGVDTATKSKLKNNQDNVTELSLVIENQGTTKNTDEGDEKSKCTSGLNFSDEKLSSDMSEEAKTGDVNVRKLRRSRHLSEAVGTCHTHEGRHSKHIAEVCTMCQKNNKGDGTSRSRKPVDQVKIPNKFKRKLEYNFSGEQKNAELLSYTSTCDSCKIVGEKMIASSEDENSSGYGTNASPKSAVTPKSFTSLRELRLKKKRSKDKQVNQMQKEKSSLELPKDVNESTELTSSAVTEGQLSSNQKNKFMTVDDSILNNKHFDQEILSDGKNSYSPKPVDLGTPKLHNTQKVVTKRNDGQDLLELANLTTPKTDTKQKTVLKSSEKKQLQIISFMVPRSQIKSWQENFGSKTSEHEKNETSEHAEIRSAEGDFIVMGTSTDSSVVGTSEFSVVSDGQNVKCKDDKHTPLLGPISKKKSKNSAEKLIGQRSDCKKVKKKSCKFQESEKDFVPDSDDEELLELEVNFLPNISQYLKGHNESAFLEADSRCTGDIFGSKEVCELTSEEIKQKHAAKIIGRYASDESDNSSGQTTCSYNVFDSIKSSFPKIIETQKYIVMSESESDIENGEKADVKEKIKRRKSEPLSLKTVQSKKRRKSEAAITPRKGMRLRTRKL